MQSLKSCVDWLKTRLVNAATNKETWNAVLALGLTFGSYVAFISWFHPKLIYFPRMYTYDTHYGNLRAKHKRKRGMVELVFNTEQGKQTAFFYPAVNRVSGHRAAQQEMLQQRVSQLMMSCSGMADDQRLVCVSVRSVSRTGYTYCATTGSAHCTSGCRQCFTRSARQTSGPQSSGCWRSHSLNC